MTIYLVVETEGKWDWQDFAILHAFKHESKAKAMQNYLELTKPKNSGAVYEVRPIEVEE